MFFPAPFVDNRSTSCVKGSFRKLEESDEKIFNKLQKVYFHINLFQHCYYQLA
jgi:hypothetical protein